MPSPIYRKKKALKAPTKDLLVKDKFHSYHSRHSEIDTINKDKKLFNSLLQEFLYRISINIIDNPSGVFLDGIGYFHVQRKEPVLLLTENFSAEYVPAFHPTKNSPFLNFTFDRTYSVSIKKTVNKQASKGKKYLNFSHLLPIAETKVFDKKARHRYEL